MSSQHPRRERSSAIPHICAASLLHAARGFKSHASVVEEVWPYFEAVVTAEQVSSPGF